MRSDFPGGFFDLEARSKKALYISTGPPRKAGSCLFLSSFTSGNNFEIGAFVGLFIINPMAPPAPYSIIKITVSEKIEPVSCLVATRNSPAVGPDRCNWGIEGPAEPKLQSSKFFSWPAMDDSGTMRKRKRKISNTGKKGRRKNKNLSSLIFIIIYYPIIRNLQFFGDRPS